LVVIAGGRIN
jgi:pyrroloquinoline-quinone synthase